MENFVNLENLFITKFMKNKTYKNEVLKAKIIQKFISIILDYKKVKFKEPSTQMIEDRRIQRIQRS